MATQATMEQCFSSSLFCLESLEKVLGAHFHKNLICAGEKKERPCIKFETVSNAGCAEAEPRLPLP